MNKEERQNEEEEKRKEGGRRDRRKMISLTLVLGRTPRLRFVRDL
jgi:hypothetical protein